MNKLHVMLTGVLVALVACGTGSSSKTDSIQVKLGVQNVKAKTYRAPSIAKAALPKPAIRASFAASTDQNLVYGYTELKARRCPAPAAAYPGSPASMKVVAGKPNLKHYITRNGQVIAHAAFKTRKLKNALRVNSPAPGEYKYVTRAVQPCKYYVNGKLRFKFYLQSRQLTRTATVAAPAAPSQPPVITNPTTEVTDPIEEPGEDTFEDEDLGWLEDSSDFSEPSDFID
jgi:hypothetical protein